MSNASAMAALYARASTDHQKYSTANQLDALRTYANKHGFKVCRTYVDEGRSGLTLAGRAGLAALLQDVLNFPPAFEHLLVYDISRWGRFQDIDESAYYEHLCKRAGVHLTYVAEPFLAEPGPMASLVKAMKRTMAAEYSRELSVKVFVGHMRVASMGFCQGGAPNYGLSRLLVDGQGQAIQLLRPGQLKAIKFNRIKLAPGPPHEVAVVRQIFHLFVNEGLTPTQIAAVLNEAGVPPPISQTWYPSVVKSLLTKERYVGTLVYNQTTLKMKQRRRKNPSAEWVRKEGAHEPIVDAQLFAAAKARIAVCKPPLTRTRERLIFELRALFLREGRLSVGLIEREPGMASPNTYSRRFGTLEAAYGLVDCPISPRGRGKTRVPTAHQARLDNLAEKLRELLARRGQLSQRIIRREPDFPALSNFVFFFGSLGAAYAYIGYQPLPPGRRPRERPEARTVIPPALPGALWPAEAGLAERAAAGNSSSGPSAITHGLSEGGACDNERIIETQSAVEGGSEACMDVVTFTNTRQNLKDVMDRVVNDHAPVIVTRQNAESVVIVSLADWNSMEETARLLSSQKNAARLSEAVAQLDAGRGAERKLIDP